MAEHDPQPEAATTPAQEPQQGPERDSGQDPGQDPQPAPAEDGEPPFGTIAPSRFAADVEYTGRAGDHDYVVRVRHRLLDTSFVVLLDGVEHDPVAEAKQEAEDDAQDIAGDTAQDGAGGDAEGDAQDDAGDGLRFTIEDGFTRIRAMVRRPIEGGEHSNSEEITVRTAGLGGAGEVEVRRGFRRIPLIPAEGTPSARREAKRAAHPTRFALMAALPRALFYLLPLLGIGVLFSGLLRPVREALERLLRPLVEGIAAVLGAIRDGIDELTAPIREFIAGLLQPVTDFLAALFRPVARAWDWLLEVLLGWIPDLDLDLPDWLFDVLVPALVVLAIFLSTLRGLRRRRALLEETRRASEGTAKAPSATDDEADSGEDDGRGPGPDPERSPPSGGGGLR